LLCHVHPGRETCFECEPGIVQVKESSKVIGSSYLSKEKTRKKEMKELSKKYGLSSSGDPGVNFTNILRAAFTSVDPKSAK